VPGRLTPTMLPRLADPPKPDEPADPIDRMAAAVDRLSTIMERVAANLDHLAGEQRIYAKRLTDLEARIGQLVDAHTARDSHIDAITAHLLAGSADQEGG
jgi:hypothetical protein